MQEMWVQSLGQEDALEKEMATQSSILAWEIPWTEEPGRLQSIRVARESDITKHACTRILDGGLRSNMYFVIISNLPLVIVQRKVAVSA